MWNHFYIEMYPHFLRTQLFSLGQKSGYTSLYRNDSTFLKKKIIQSLLKCSDLHGCAMKRKSVDPSEVERPRYSPHKRI